MADQNINKLIARKLLGQLTEAEQQELDRLMKAHPEWAARYKELLEEQGLMRRYQAYRETPMPEIPLPDKAAKVSKHQTWLRPFYWRTAASVAAAVAVVWFLWPAQKQTSSSYDNQPLANQQPTTKSALAQGEANNSNILPDTTSLAQPWLSHVDSITTSTATASEQMALSEGMMVSRHKRDFWLTLDDGTRVHLDYNSQLTYPIHFIGATREVQLQGNAYFLVAHDTSRSFVVKTQTGEVVDYGTEFDISTNREHTDVVLISGSVGVKPDGAAEMLLKPGQKASWTTGSDIGIAQVDLTPYVAWNQDRFTFDECQLGDLMFVVGRWYGCQVHFETPDLSQRHFTGSLSRRNDAGTTLGAIAEAAGLSMQLEGNTIVVGKK